MNKSEVAQKVRDEVEKWFEENMAPIDEQFIKDHSSVEIDKSTGIIRFSFDFNPSQAQARSKGMEQNDFKVQVK